MRPIILGLTVLLAACSQAPPRTGLGMSPVDMPPWTRTGEHPEFPAQEYVRGFGIARTRAAAESQAVARLEETLVAHALGRDGGALSGSHFARLVAGRATWLPLGDFGDAVRSETVGNGFEFVAVRALRREDLPLFARGMLPSAREALRAVPDAMPGPFKRRVDSASRAFLSAARVVALRLLAEGAVEQHALERAENAGLDLQELPHLATVTQSGAGQVARLQGGLDEPLRLDARFAGSVLNALPLRWGTALGMRGTLDGDTQTDEIGHAQCRVLQLAPTGEEFGIVQCAIDLDRLTPRRTGLSLPPWAWKVTLPCRANTELIVNVNETIDGSKDDFKAMFVPPLKDWCKGRNLAIGDGKVEGEFTYRLRLEGEIEIATWTEHDLPMARAGGKVSLRDAADGRELYTWTPGLLREGAKGNSLEGQAMLALREVAAEGLAEFCTRLVAIAPAPGEEFSRR